MYVEGTLRWQVTEDSPWDLLLAVCLRELGGLTDIAAPAIPSVAPAPAPRSAPATAPTVAPGRSVTVRSADDADAVEPERAILSEQWTDWWTQLLDRRRRPLVSTVRPPHYAAFDRTLELQDLVARWHDEALAWTRERHREYHEETARTRPAQAADVVETVRRREHQLRRQAGYFRLDLVVLPLSRPGAWIAAPDTVVISSSLRSDSAAFRSWFEPFVAVLV